MKAELFPHQDRLQGMVQHPSLSQKLETLHGAVRQMLPFVDRIAITVYDAQTDLLKTLAHSSGGGHPLSNYQAKLSEIASLRQILTCERPRVVNDLDLFAGGQKMHTRRIAEQGYKASYTLPVYAGGNFAGFVFFDSYQKNVFTEGALQQLDVFGHLAALLLVNQIMDVHTLLASLKSAEGMVHTRDFETGAHLQRLANYARLIAQALATRYRLSDEYIEAIFRFAPLHDIGKIAIPDNILMKPGRLTSQERAAMKTHTTKGAAIIDELLQNFGLDGLPYTEMLRNIALYHHERMDGRGYPSGLSGQAIPLEARIVAVADVFDALTSRRRYKPAWPINEAFEALERLADSQFDRHCVEALVSQRALAEEIQSHFCEDDGHSVLPRQERGDK